MRPRLIAGVGRTKKIKNTYHVQTKENASGFSGRRGQVAAGRNSFRMTWRSRAAAPLSSVSSVGRGKLRDGPSVKATSSTDRQGTLIPMTPAGGRGSIAQRQRGQFNTAGLLRGAVVRAQPTNGVTRHVRSEWLVRSPCRLSGFTIARVTARRSAGGSSVGSVSGVGVGESLARPSRPTAKWSRRA